MRYAALEALRLSGRKSDKMLGRFRQAVSDSDPIVRLAALRGLTCCLERLGQADWKLVREVFLKDRGEPRVQAALLLLLGGQADEPVLKLLCHLVTTQEHQPLYQLQSWLSFHYPEFNLRYGAISPISSRYRTDVARAVMLLPAIPDPLVRAFIEVVTQQRHGFLVLDFMPVLRAPALDQAHLDNLRKRLSAEVIDPMQMVMILAILARHLPEREVVAELEAALQKFPGVRTLLTTGLFYKARNWNLKEIVPLLRILVEHKASEQSRSQILVLLYYFTRDKQVLEKLLEEWKKPLTPVMPMEVEMVLNTLDADNDATFCEILESALDRKLQRVPTILLFRELARKGINPPDRLVPKLRVLFWAAPTEDRIHLGEILYRKEAYQPARVMLETLARADVSAYVRQQASEALTRLGLANETAKNPPKQRAKNLLERWKAMEMAHFRILQNYPLVIIPRISSISPLLLHPHARIDLVDPLLEEIRKQDADLARKLEELD